MTMRAALPFLVTLSAAAASGLMAQTAAPISTASLRGLTIALDGTIWASGTVGTVLRSTDSGKTWELRSISAASDGDLRDIEAISASTAYAMVAGDGTAQIYKTTDGGQTWTRQYDDRRKAAFLDGIAFWDEAHGIAFGDPIDGHFLILRTEDGGTHWTVSSAADAPAALKGEAGFAASGSSITVGAGGHVWIGTGGATDSGAVARVLHSTDYGRTWQVSETPIPSGTSSTGIFSLAFRDPQYGVAVGGDYVSPEASRPNVAVTTDGGKTWKLADSARVTTYLSAVTYVPGSNGKNLIAVGTAGTFESTDGGHAWRRVNNTSHNAVAAGKKTVVAVGEEGRTSVESR